ncbi:MAG TPA: Asr1405/Asl0597 family protein [Trichocoleus sp.]|jgi:hypothetical protein
MESSEPLTRQAIIIDRSTRWQALQRLQELEISCSCSSDGGLIVEVNTPTAIVQVQSVVQQLTASRRSLVHQLDRCWNLPSSPNY